MKAIYQKPSTEFMSTMMSQLMVASPVEKGFDPNSDDVPTTDATSGNLSRRKVWDDEDEEF